VAGLPGFSDDHPSRPPRPGRADRKSQRAPEALRQKTCTKPVDATLIWPSRLHPEAALQPATRTNSGRRKTTVALMFDDTHGGPAGSATACRRAGFCFCVRLICINARV